MRFNLRVLVIYVPFFLALAIAGWTLMMQVGCERHQALPRVGEYGGYTYDSWRVRHWPQYLKHRFAVWHELGR